MPIVINMFEQRICQLWSKFSVFSSSAHRSFISLNWLTYSNQYQMFIFNPRTHSDPFSLCRPILILERLRSLSGKPKPLFSSLMVHFFNYSKIWNFSEISSLANPKIKSISKILQITKKGRKQYTLLRNKYRFIILF